jgi:hypothetical protein
VDKEDAEVVDLPFYPDIFFEAIECGGCRKKEISQ